MSLRYADAMSDPASAYTMELRVLLCPSCGAPVGVPTMGGTTTCRFCAVQSHVGPRVKAAPSGELSPTRLSESERWAGLLAQVGEPLLPPARIAPLFARGFASGWRREDVRAAWQSARARTAARGADAHEAAHELVYLTSALGNQFVQAKDWTGHRAMLESALEAFFLPRHRSAIAADLCSGACGQGDVVGATMWLELCDPASEDLYADSGYRVARARLARLKGDFPDVLVALGARAGAVPIHTSFNTTATVARAHALENVGALAEATHELDDVMGGGPDVRRHVELLARMYSLCARSLPPALAAVTERASHVAANAAGGRPRPGLLSAVFGERSGAAAVAAERARRLAFVGRPAQGKVLSILDTGTRIDDAPLFRLHVRVELEGVASYEGAVELLLTPERAESFLGTVIFLLVDPVDPAQIAAEAIAGPAPS